MNTAKPFILTIMNSAASAENDEGGAAVATQAPPQHKPAEPISRQLPPWNVLLHNDDVNVFDHVVLTLIQIARLNVHEARMRTHEAHVRGMSLVCTTHREHAELMCEQLASKGLTATAEPA